MTQLVQRLMLPASNGAPASARRLQGHVSIPPAKLLADLLKRQARSVCAAVTECDAATMPAHLARLDDLRDTVAHLLRHDHRDGPEAVLAFNPLAGAYSLADWLTVLEYTRRMHRAPSFVASRDSDLEQINRKLDTIAGFLAAHPLHAAMADALPLDGDAAGCLPVDVDEVFSRLKVPVTKGGAS